VGFDYARLAVNEFELPQGWQVSRVSDVAEVNARSVSSGYPHDIIRYIDLSSVNRGTVEEVQDIPLAEAPSRARRIVRDRDILVGTVRPNLRHYAFLKQPAANTIASTGFAVVTARDVDARYLYYYLTSDPFTDYLSRIADSHTSAYPAFNPDVIENAELLLPPPSQQRGIAHVLGTLDDKIELNRQMNATLEAVAWTIFKSWFVDFDPVIDNALRAGNPIPDELANRAAQRQEALDASKPMVPDHLAQLFPDAFQDSNLGPIPGGWGIASLDQIAEYLNGVAWQKYRAAPDERSLPVIKIRELRDGFSENTDHASLDVPDEYIVEDGDVLFSWSGSLVVNLWTSGRGILNQHLFKVSSPDYPKWFYYLWTIEHLERFQRIAADKATTMGHIKREHLSQARALIPSDGLLQAMTDAMRPVLDRQISNDLESRTLAATRDALLAKLLSGEVRVDETGAPTSAVAQAPAVAEGRLYTVGHSNHSLETFLELIKRHGVTAVADVRSVPFSRYSPQFNRDHLTRALKDAGIAYVFLGKELGARPDDPACYEKGRASFDRMASRPEFREGIERLRTGMQEYVIALLCAEKDPLDCHRTILVSRHLQEAGLRVTHILPDGELEPNHETERRLLEAYGLERGLFDSSDTDSERLAEAYDKRAHDIAYKRDNKEAE
jgi:type I restriction enzyme S subunit